MYNKVLTRELLDLKTKVMIQKIDKLYSICNMLFQSSETRESKSLEVIKEQYLQMCNKLIETGQYEKYKEVEDIVIKEIAKVELNIDQYIYDTSQSYEEIIKRNIQKIYQSRNYQDFNNLDQEMQHIGTLKELLRLYSPYISKNETEKMQEEITKLKFDLLYRKQVEELIYENGGANSNLVQYDNKDEKAIFERLLEEKMNSLKNKSADSTGKIEEDDKLFKIPIKQVLSDSKLLERLIIIDMKKNPCNYINLLKAKIFNAHLCNIKKYDTVRDNLYFYSMLKALLKNIITNKNVSYIDCENLYRKFGFECNPIAINIGQQCVKMIANEAKGSQEYINILNELKKKKENSQEQYCKIYYVGLKYLYERKDTDTEDLFYEVISKRDIKLSPSSLKRKKEKIKKEGKITTDIDIIILLINDIIKEYHRDMCSFYIDKDLPREKQLLEKLKSKKGKLTLHDAKLLLEDISWVYDMLNIKYNRRETILLEYEMDLYDGKCMTSELWKRYKNEFRKLGIDVKLIPPFCDPFYYYTNIDRGFEACVNLGDISDLPIDYEKVQLLTKEELTKIREREIVKYLRERD